MTDKELIFDAIFFKATTTVDGAWRITFDVGCNEGENVARLTKLAQSALKVVVLQDGVPLPDMGDFET